MFEEAVWLLSCTHWKCLYQSTVRNESWTIMACWEVFMVKVELGMAPCIASCSLTSIFSKLRHLQLTQLATCCQFATQFNFWGQASSFTKCKVSISYVVHSWDTCNAWRFFVLCIVCVCWWQWLLLKEEVGGLCETSHRQQQPSWKKVDFQSLVTVFIMQI